MKPSKRQLESAVKRFNIDFPVGSPCVVVRDYGGITNTTVKGAAEVLGGHSAVAWFDGISGCYAIDRVHKPGATP